MYAIVVWFVIRVNLGMSLQPVELVEILGLDQVQIMKGYLKKMQGDCLIIKG